MSSTPIHFRPSELIPVFREIDAASNTKWLGNRAAVLFSESSAIQSFTATLGTLGLSSTWTKIRTGRSTSGEIALFGVATTLGVGLGYILTDYTYYDCASPTLLDKLKDTTTWKQQIFEYMLKKAKDDCEKKANKWIKIFYDDDNVGDILSEADKPQIERFLKVLNNPECKSLQEG